MTASFEKMTVGEVVDAVASSGSLAVICHTNPDGDTVGCAAALCHGALEAAAMNVWVNTKGLPGDPEGESLNAEVRRILDRALPLTAEISARVRAKLEI